MKSEGGIASRPELDETDFLFSDMGLKLFEYWKRLSASVASEDIFSSGRFPTIIS